MAKDTNIIVGVGDICFSTDNGETHTMLAAGQECVLSTLDLACLRMALDAYDQARRK